jgi:hypothetical protein
MAKFSTLWADLVNNSKKLDNPKGKLADEYFTSERLSNIARDDGYAMNDSSKSAFALVDPKDFVEATTFDRMHVNKIIREAGDLDFKRFSDEYQTPFLTLDNVDGNWNIQGHEGRHRMAALAKAGVEEAPVLIRKVADKYESLDDVPTSVRNQFDDPSIKPFNIDIKPFHLNGRWEDSEAKGKINDWATLINKKHYLNTLPEEKLVDIGYPEETAKRIASGDLPMDYASRMARQKSSPYQTNALHGTDANFNKFDESKIGKTDSGTLGRGFYADSQADMINDEIPVGANKYAMKKNGNVMPLLFDMKNPLVIKNPATDIPINIKAGSGRQNKANLEQLSEDRKQWLIDNGYDSVIWDKGNGKKEYMVLNANQIRSKNAAFDPEYSGDNILGFNKQSNFNPVKNLATTAKGYGGAEMQEPAQRPTEKFGDWVTKALEGTVSPQMAEKIGGHAETVAQFTPMGWAADGGYNLTEAVDKGEITTDAALSLLDFITMGAGSKTNALKGK